MISVDFFIWPAGLIRPREPTISVWTTLICAALIWLCYRAWLVLRIPLSQLVDPLGLEVPRAPDVSLAGIDSETITLHWIRPDDASSVSKYLIQVNDIIVGDSITSETAITVSGLHPDHFYTVRVIAVNANSYQNAGSVIHLKTLSVAERRERSNSVSSAAHTGTNNVKGTLWAGERQAGVFQPTPSTTSAAPARDRHIVNQQRKRAGHDKKGPALNHVAMGSTVPSAEQSKHEEGQSNFTDSDLTIDQLNDRLESILGETEEMSSQKSKEEEEFQASRASAIRERDRLKLAFKEKEDVSAELKREVASLERQNRTAQSNKTAKERLLRQKQEDRKKLQQDIERWDREVDGYQKDIEKLRRQRRKIVENTGKEVQVTRGRIGQWQTSIKEMEEDIRLKGAQIKELEEQRRRDQAEANEAEARDQERRAREEETKWEAKLRDLQALYTKTLHGVQQAQETYRQAQERLVWWRTHGVSNAAQSAALASQALDPLTNHPLQRGLRRNKSQSQSATRSSPVNAVNGTLVESRFATTSAPSMPSLFSFQPTIDRHPTLDASTLNKEDVDQLAAGAKMSPRADSLLPSGLLGDEDMLTPRIGSIGANLDANHTSDTSVFPTFAAAGFDGFMPETNSPDSAGSREISLFSSPADSLSHLPGSHVATDSSIRSKRVSQSSFDGPYQPLGAAADADSPSSKRFPSLFGWNLNRQRGRTLDVDPPALGELKPNQSQSFPRDWDQPSGRLDPIGTKRRKGSASTSWINPIPNFNFRSRSGGLSSEAVDEDQDITTKNASQRRKGFTMFASKTALLNLPSTGNESAPQRPSSVSSAEKTLPRPSIEGQAFGWPPQRNNFSGGEWSVPSGDPWSHGPSRRSSVQYGSTTSLSLGITSIETDPSVGALSGPTSSPQPPIGTRPQSASRAEAPKLNPAAPSFKTIFSRKDIRRMERAEKMEREAELELEKQRERERDREFEMMNEEAASGHRNSRDSRSLHTEESQTDSRDSLDRSESATASDSAPASGNAKGSIFQRISRKHSSSKFNAPWKDKGARPGKRTSDYGAASTASGTTTSGEVDDDGGGGGGGGGSTDALSQLGKSVDSITSSPNLTGGGGGGATASSKSTGLSWTSLRRKGKKGDRSAVGSVTDKTSDRGDDEDGGG